MEEGRSCGSGGGREDGRHHVGGEARLSLDGHGWQDGTERGETASAGRPSRHPLPRHRRGRTDLPRLVRHCRGCQRRVRTPRQREQHPGTARYPTPESRQDRPRGPVLPPAASMMFMPRKYGTWTTEV